MPTIEDQALVLDHHPFGDRHLVLAVLTHRSGVQRGILRRARGGKAPTAAAAQIMSLVHVGLFQKPQAELATYRHLDLITSSFPLTRELGRSAAAAVIAELLITYCPPAEPTQRAFRLGVSCLEALLEDVPANTVVAYAEFWILVLGGVFPTGATIEEALDGDSIGILTEFRTKALMEIPTTVTPAVSRWLDGQVRAEAERSLRALSFYRQMVPSGGTSDGPIR